MREGGTAGRKRGWAGVTSGPGRCGLGVLIRAGGGVGAWREELGVLGWGGLRDPHVPSVLFADGPEAGTEAAVGPGTQAAAPWAQAVGLSGLTRPGLRQLGDPRQRLQRAGRRRLPRAGGEQP